MNTISNGELSDPLCDSVYRGLTLVRLSCKESWIFPSFFDWLLFIPGPQPLSLFTAGNWCFSGEGFGPCLASCYILNTTVSWFLVNLFSTGDLCYWSLQTRLIWGRGHQYIQHSLPRVVSILLFYGELLYKPKGSYPVRTY